MKACFILFTISFAACMVNVMAEGDKEKCSDICTMDYKPVCGHEGGKPKTFPNRCALDNRACSNRNSGGPAIEYQRDGPC
ncbi:Kazal-type serine protease inhibitor domain [Nesidiocoris tenuis]|uniref:Kazal-type serine protease inhibitor domain n=1 Tax=Nesidiocoris tenuis TaxID=355587 RepID=A0ABN7ACX5_9HEMI|nr:Kazal-type serine protease inhibitor domain [Nesidiocoris tenuis]